MSSKTPVEVTCVIRQMRGRSQSFLVKGIDGHQYVCKFTCNPQGKHSLVNEWIAGNLLAALGVATPSLTMLRLGQVCQGTEKLTFTDNLRRVLHLGSRCPVDPDTKTILDFLPSKLYSELSNRKHIGVVFAFDQWVAQCDRRQFIFTRQPDLTKDTISAHKTFTAWAIDHGMCFEGANWSLPVGQLPPRLMSNDIYSHCNLEQSAVEGARLIESLPYSELQAAIQCIPDDWFSPGEEAALNSKMKRLQARQKGFASLIAEQMAALSVSQTLLV